jgi:hypothetical protein
VLASQSEAALDRSETFLRNQDPYRTLEASSRLAASSRIDTPWRLVRYSNPSHHQSGH